MEFLSFSKSAKNSNLFLWVILIFVVLGFGKYKNTLLGLTSNINKNSEMACNFKKSKSCCTIPTDNNKGFFASELLNNNLVFIGVIVLLLILSRDKVHDEKDSTSESIEVGETDEQT